MVTDASITWAIFSLVKSLRSTVRLWLVHRVQRSLNLNDTNTIKLPNWVSSINALASFFLPTPFDFVLHSTAPWTNLTANDGIQVQRRNFLSHSDYLKPVKYICCVTQGKQIICGVYRTLSRPFTITRFWTVTPWLSSISTASKIEDR